MCSQIGIASSSVITAALNPTKLPSQSPTTVKICRFSAYCRTSTDCHPGNSCVTYSAYYSLCVPDPTTYLPSTTNCVPDFNDCSGGKKCCDPGAICTAVNPYFSACRQPEPYTTPLQCSDPHGFPTPSGSSTSIGNQPTLSPASKTTTAPTPPSSSSLKICQFSGYCRSNSDCFPGNSCVSYSPYYSQCVPDPSQYANAATTGCAAEYGNCQNGKGCCDPGATCIYNNPYFSICRQPTPQSQPQQCRDPISFPATTSLPSPSPSHPHPTSRSPTYIPTAKFTNNPTMKPSNRPSTTRTPSEKPIGGTNVRTLKPTNEPTYTVTFPPLVPTESPSFEPSLEPTIAAGHTVGMRKPHSPTPRPKL